MAEFPKLAAEVTASLLGLYLATVGIVVGTVYQDVSADIRCWVAQARCTDFGSPVSPTGTTVASTSTSTIAA